MRQCLRTAILLLTAILPLRGQELFEPGIGRSPRWASFENPKSEKGGAGGENKTAKGHAFDSLKAGQSITLMEYNGSGVIRRIWITINDRSPEMIRSLTLAAYWEGEAKPAVLAPPGDFFGIAHGQLCAFESALLSNPEGRSFNCLFPMPFRRSGRVVLSNDSNKDVSNLFYDVDFETVKPLPEDALYFHCYWNRQVRTQLGEDYQILPQVTGRGRLLGVNVGVLSSPDYGDSWWGEGEVKMYLDGDDQHPPSREPAPRTTSARRGDWASSPTATRAAQWPMPPTVCGRSIASIFPTRFSLKRT
jgi:D-arabinan exo alpha-(1,3)/(1,5)-arabinofuranosidase (non-reducing end)